MVKRIRTGDIISGLSLESVNYGTVQIPHPASLVHLQLRRFAGCMFCSLHLRSILQRHDEISSAGIVEVVVMHSSANAIHSQLQQPMPFALVPDPKKTLYARFGVEAGARAVLHPQMWVRSLRAGLLKGRFAVPSEGESPVGFPADFLIGTDGRVLACKYGKHAYDQWSVDEILELARREVAPAQVSRAG